MAPPLSVHLVLLLAPFVEPADIARCQRVSKHWHSIFNAPVLARTLLRTHLSHLTPPTSPELLSDPIAHSKFLSRRFSALKNGRPRTLLHIPIIRGATGLLEYVYTYSSNLIVFQSRDELDASVITLLHLSRNTSVLQTLALRAGDARARLHILRYCPHSHLLVAQTETSAPHGGATVTTHLEAHRITPGGKAPPSPVSRFAIATAPAHTLTTARRLFDLTGDYCALISVHVLSRVQLTVWHVPSGTEVLSRSLVSFRPEIPVALSIARDGTATVVFTPHAHPEVVIFRPDVSADAPPERHTLLSSTVHSDATLITLRKGGNDGDLEGVSVDLVAVSSTDPNAGETVTYHLTASSPKDLSSELPSTYTTNHLTPIAPVNIRGFPLAASRILYNRSGSVRLALRCEARQRDFAGTRLLAFWVSITMHGAPEMLLGQKVFPAHQPMRDMEDILLGDDEVTVVQGVGPEGWMGLWVLAWDGADLASTAVCAGEDTDGKVGLMTVRENSPLYKWAVPTIPGDPAEKYRVRLGQPLDETMYEPNVVNAIS
ncbi:hypothetical protein EDC01DRAFT_64244 [Geopyxis carbonaria]|nr:hypothetical protein EDC01DRAFT_64244 [Geopyxis carbonaria]